MKRTLKNLFLVENPIRIAGAELFPLFVEWKNRYGAKDGSYTYKPLTEETLWDDRIASGDAPASYSEVLDAADRMMNAGWITIPCWVVRKDHPHYEDAKKDAYRILNTYMSGPRHVKEASGRQVAARGYAAELVDEAVAYEERGQ